MNTKQRTLVSALFAATGTAGVAQPFAHHIGEPAEAREFGNDLTLTDSADIIEVGGIGFDTAGLALDGYFLATDADGIPFLSLIIEDPASELGSLIAVRQDPADSAFLQLQQSRPGPGAPVSDIVLHKLDPFAGGLPFAWRYPITSLGENLGMELDGQTGLVAATIESSAAGTQPTLLRFDNASGLPVFHWRYLTVDAPAFDGRFFDVAVDPASGRIYAVGSIRVDAAGFTPESELLIAAFTPAGAPIWFNAYELSIADNDDAGRTEGTSIEINGRGEVVVTARVADPVFGSLSAHVVVEPGAGGPLAANAVVNPGAFFDAAYSSLELRPDGKMLASGTTVSAAGTVSPAMWSFDASSGLLDWAYVSDVEDGRGTSAIPQVGDERGPLLGGEVFPNSGTVGGLHDVLLARTTASGDGECPATPDLRELSVRPRRLQIPVQAVEMPNPQQAELRAVQGEPIQKFVCDPCPADLAPPFGVLNFFDIVEYISLYTAMDPAADLAAPFGAFNFFDIAAYIALYNAGCP